MPSAIPAETIERLQKLIPRLASDHDGEVIATVHAISRVLSAAQLDWHDLARAVQPPKPPNVFEVDLDECMRRATERPDPSAPDATAQKWGLPIWGTKKVEPWNVVASHCLQMSWAIPKKFGGKFLTERDKDRLRRFEKWGRVTNADAAWIESIFEKCRAVREEWRSQPKAAA